MSELKAKHVVDVYDEYSDNPTNETQVYLKSEADKVIADLEESHKMEVEQLLIEIAELEAQNHDLEEERRWRKFSEEKPKEKQWIHVYYGYENNGCRIDLRRWDNGCKYDVEFQELYTHWMPLPSAPNEVK